MTVGQGEPQVQAGGLLRQRLQLAQPIVHRQAFEHQVAHFKLTDLAMQIEAARWLDGLKP